MDEQRPIPRHIIMKFYNPRVKEDPKSLVLGWGVEGKGSFIQRIKNQNDMSVINQKPESNRATH